MYLLAWILALDALVLIAIGVAGGIAEACAARARERAEEADWALLYSWLRQASPPGARGASSQT